MSISARLVLDDERVYEQLSRMGTPARNALLKECSDIHSTCRVDYNRIQKHTNTKSWIIPIYIDIGGADRVPFLQAFFTATIRKKMTGRSTIISWDTTRHNKAWVHPDHRKKLPQ